MPRTRLLFYRDAHGRCPVVDWLEELRGMDPGAYAKCAAAVQRLAEFGHDLRRPTADYLRDGIHELRSKRGRVNYRILYFFHGRNVAVLAHALLEEAAVDSTDIERAKVRKLAFETDPARHTESE